MKNSLCLLALFFLPTPAFATIYRYSGDVVVDDEQYRPSPFQGGYGFNLTDFSLFVDTYARQWDMSGDVDQPVPFDIHIGGVLPVSDVQFNIDNAGDMRLVWPDPTIAFMTLIGAHIDLNIISGSPFLVVNNDVLYSGLYFGTGEFLNELQFNGVVHLDVSEVPEPMTLVYGMLLIFSLAASSSSTIVKSIL